MKINTLPIDILLMVYEYTMPSFADIHANHMVLVCEFENIMCRSSIWGNVYDICPSDVKSYYDVKDDMDELELMILDLFDYIG